MCTGCGSSSVLAAPASTSRIFRAVTLLDPTGSSIPPTLRSAPPRLPARDAARVHDLDRVGSGGSEEPRHLLAHTCQLACHQLARSEERRVGKECRSRWSPYH